jgi:hypothetical protein
MLWEGAPIAGAVELAKVREAGGEFERHAERDGPHVSKVHSRLGGLIQVVQNTESGDAIEEW